MRLVDDEAGELLPTMQGGQQVSKGAAFDDLRSKAARSAIRSCGSAKVKEAHLLGRHVGKTRLRRAGAQAAHDESAIFSRHRRAEKDDRDVLVVQRTRLIRNEGQQGRDDDRKTAGDARADDGRELEAQRLAAAGREEDKDVLARQGRVDRRFLVRPKLFETEPLPQGLVDVASPRVLLRRRSLGRDDSFTGGPDERDIVVAAAAAERAPFTR